MFSALLIPLHIQPQPDVLIINRCTNRETEKKSYIHVPRGMKMFYLMIITTYQYAVWLSVRFNSKWTHSICDNLTKWPVAVLQFSTVYLQIFQKMKANKFFFSFFHFENYFMHVWFNILIYNMTIVHHWLGFNGSIEISRYLLKIQICWKISCRKKNH